MRNYLDAAINDDIYARKPNSIEFVLTNARLLAPKITSLLDMMREMGLDFAATTETWFMGGKQLKREVSDIEQATGVKIIYRNRKGGKQQRGGGVAIAFRTDACNFKERKIKAIGDLEMLCATGRVANIKRKVVIFVIYLPPRTSKDQRENIIERLVSEVAAVKVAYGDPLIVVCGDMNGRNVEEALIADSFTLLDCGPKRGANKQDLVYTNASPGDASCETLPPL